MSKSSNYFIPILRNTFDESSRLENLQNRLSRKQKKRTRSEAIDLIRARTLVRMSPTVSSSENSPVKSEPPGGSPAVSPKKSPVKSQNEIRSTLKKPQGTSPSKSPVKPSGNIPKMSPGRYGEQSRVLDGGSVRLFQAPVPVFEPFSMPKKYNEKGINPEAPPWEESPATSTSEPVNPSLYSNIQSTEQAIYSKPHSSTLIPGAIQDIPSFQSAPYLALQLQKDYSKMPAFDWEWRAPLEHDKSQAANEWESPEMSASTDDSGIAGLTESLALTASSENISDPKSSSLSASTTRPSTTTTTRPALSPIQETSSRVTPTSPRFPTLTPEFSFNENNSNQIQATETTNATATPTTTTASSPAKSQAFTSLSLSTHSSPTNHARVLTQKPTGFFYQLDSHGFPCASPDCDTRCNLWDGASVICPGCGPYSEIRYCSKKHLLEDVKWHWLWCGQLEFQHACRENSIPRDIREEGVPMVPCLHGGDTPERQRQALWFNVCAGRGDGDYFIFSDWGDLVEGRFVDAIGTRCEGRAAWTVSFEDDKERDRFRRVLAACLFLTIEIPTLADYLFRLIRTNLQSKNTWTKAIDHALRHQLSQELSVPLHPSTTGERHACPTDWDGRSRRACKDSICRDEYRRLLGSFGGGLGGGLGVGRLLDYLENGYWVLRAARTTHPVVKGVRERMRGIGFEGVLEEDRRMFCRGVGWDGAGSGGMEIEGVTL